MALGHQFATDADFDHALEDFLAGSQHEGLHDSRTLHCAPGGWYSSEVIGQAVTSVSLRKAGKVQYVMQLRPLYVAPSHLHTCVGAIVNIDDKHWVALKAVSGEIWLLDSQRKPRKLEEEEYIAYVNKRRATYPIAWAEDMATVSTNAGPSLSSLSSLDDATASSPLLPLASLETVDSMAVIPDSIPAAYESMDENMGVFAGRAELGMRHTSSDAMGSTGHIDTNVPALMVAETHGEEGLVAFERSVYNL